MSLKKSPFILGLIMGMGLAQIFYILMLFLNQPPYKTLYEQLGLSVPWLTTLAMSPIIFPILPLLVVGLITGLIIFIKIKEKPSLAIPILLLIMNWLLLALIVIGIYQPLFSVMSKVG